jgi:hypothetical protein
MENLAPEMFRIGPARALAFSLPGAGAQPLSSAAQLLRTRLIAASFDCIASLYRSQKSRRVRIFHQHLCNFRATKIFSAQLASLRLFLCYYRQRSLKIFRRFAVVGRT